jgi:hypothetical protein
MNDQEFFDLAVKVVGHQAGEAERAALQAAMANRPELKAEFEKIQADARLAREVLPLLAAVEAAPGEFPAYARERLQTKVRQIFGRPDTVTKEASEKELKTMWRWRWVLGLAAATAVVALLLTPILTKPGAPVLQVALLDAAGATRGSDANETTLLRQTWEKATIDSFSSTGDLRAWETNWPPQTKGPVVKIVFDRAAGEVRVLGRWKGDNFTKTFLIEEDLAITLRQANDFIRVHTAH